MDSRFDKQDAVLSALQTQMSAMSVKQGEHHEIFKSHSKRLDAHDAAMKLIGDKFDAVEKKIDDNKDEVSKKFQALDTLKTQVAVAAAFVTIAIAGLGAYVGKKLTSH
jgi:phage-related minor tail protein